ncbi:MAG: hypothetical protein NT116_04515, partial [Candidatus Parcubacteria bacterium]|nr:hypothetical protein [Candidatus Parcubacteria bacterium]
MENQNFENNIDEKTKAKEQFLAELEDMITDPRYKHLDFDTSVIEKLKDGKKIKYDRWAEQLLVKVGQDFRLTWQEID